MAEKYKVRVNGNMEFQFSKEELSGPDIKSTTDGALHVLSNSRSSTAEVLQTDFLKKTYRIKVNGNSYDVQISNELDLLIEDMGLDLAAAQVVNDIKAPMPGLILDVKVKEGQEVKAGDYLLVLEAMKMENTLTAPRDGVVKSVTIRKGQTVGKNQLLIEME